MTDMKAKIREAVSAASPGSHRDNSFPDRLYDEMVKAGVIAQEPHDPRTVEAVRVAYQCTDIGEGYFYRLTTELVKSGVILERLSAEAAAELLWDPERGFVGTYAIYEGGYVLCREAETPAPQANTADVLDRMVWCD